MKKGDIVSVIFPFTDLSSSKQMPALVLYVAQEDAILAFITSKISFQHTSDIAIKQSLINNLKTDSLIIVRKLFTGNKKLIKGKIGELDTAYYTGINKSISTLLNL